MVTMSMSWNMAFIVGSMIGGVFVDPHNSSFYSAGFFEKHPFLFPNLVPAAIGLLSLVITGLFVRETLVKDERLMIAQSRSFLGILKERKVVLTQAAYFMIAGAGTGFHEVFSLWVFAEQSDGGFALNPSSIGLIVMVSTLSVIPFQK